jgi:ankyrin repeat protein
MFRSGGSHIADLNRRTPASVRNASENKEENAKLFRAIENGNLADAEAALKAGANPNYSENECSMLCYVVIFTYPAASSHRMSKLLLEHGANPNFTYGGDSLFHKVFFERKDIDLARLLKAHGADINKPDGMIPLQRAVKLQDESKIKILLEMGVRLDLDDFKPGQQAYICNYLVKRFSECIHELSNALGKEDVTDHINTINHFGKYLVESRMKDYRANVRDYLGRRVLEAVNALNQRLPLQKAKVDLAKVIKDIEILQGYGSDGFKKKDKVVLLRCLNGIDDRIENLQNDFLIAVLKKDDEKIAQHLADNIDVNYVSKDGRTPLSVAATDGTRETFDLLVKHGAVIPWHNKTNAGVVGRIRISDKLIFSLSTDFDALFNQCVAGKTNLALISSINQMTALFLDHPEIIQVSYNFIAYLKATFAMAAAYFPAKFPRRVNARDTGSALNAITEKLDILSWPGSESLCSLMDAFKEKIKAEVKIQSELLLKAQTLVDVEDALAAGADVNYQDEEGCTALMRATRSGNAILVEELRKRGANENVELAMINLPTRASLKATAEKMVLQAVNDALFEAITARNFTLVESLIAKDPKVVDRPDMVGAVPLMAAANKNARDIVELLIRSGAKIDWEFFGSTESTSKGLILRAPLSKSAVKCICDVLCSMIQKDIDELFKFRSDNNTREFIKHMNEKTAHFTADAFNDDRDAVRKYFIDAINSKRLALKHSADLALLTQARDGLLALQHKVDGVAIIQRKPDEKKDKTAMRELLSFVDDLNKRISKVQPEEVAPTTMPAQAKLTASVVAVDTAKVDRAQLNKNLFIAIKNRNLSEIQAAIQAGADPNGPNEFGQPPLYIAILFRLGKEAYEYLLSVGAEANVEVQPVDKSISLLAYAMSTNEMPAVVLLMDRKVKSGFLKYDENLWLMASESTEMLQLLINAGFVLDWTKFAVAYYRYSEDIFDNISKLILRELCLLSNSLLNPVFDVEASMGLINSNIRYLNGNPHDSLTKTRARFGKVLVEGISSEVNRLTTNSNLTLFKQRLSMMMRGLEFICGGLFKNKNEFMKSLEALMITLDEKIKDQHLEKPAPVIEPATVDDDHAVMKGIVDLANSSGGLDTDTLIDNLNKNTANFLDKLVHQRTRKNMRKHLMAVFNAKDASIPLGDRRSLLNVLCKVVTRLRLIQGPGQVNGEKEAMHVLKTLRDNLSVQVDRLALIEEYAEPNVIIDPFLELTSGNKTRMMAALEKRVDVNCHNASGETPLTFLARYYDKEALQLLIAHGATIDWFAISCSASTGEQIGNVSDALRAVHKQEMQALMQEINPEKIASFIESINKKMEYFADISKKNYKARVDELLLKRGCDGIDSRFLCMPTYSFVRAEVLEDLKNVILDKRMALASIADQAILTAVHACLKQALDGLTIFKMDDMKELKSLVDRFLQHLQARIDRLTGADAPSYQPNHTQFYAMTSAQKAEEKARSNSKEEVYYGFQDNILDAGL